MRIIRSVMSRGSDSAATLVRVAFSSKGPRAFEQRSITDGMPVAHESAHELGLVRKEPGDCGVLAQVLDRRREPLEERVGADEAAARTRLGDQHRALDEAVDFARDELRQNLFL